jgi:hypothetical protein
MIILSEKWNVKDRGIGKLVHLSETLPEILKTIRILAGTVVLTYEFGGESRGIRLRENYIRFDEEIKYGHLDDIFPYIFEDGIPDENELAKIFDSIKYLNIEFYREVRQEISYAVFSLEKERFTESFLYLYRTLERISAACPLLFVSREVDFRAAHSFLNGFFLGSKMPGELKILDNFLKNYSKRNEMFRDAVLEIKMPDNGNFMNKEIFEQWNLIKEEGKLDLYIDDEFGVISCPYPDVPSLVASIRNRVFHNEGGRRNVSLAKIGGSEPFFKICTRPILRWFSYLFVDFAKWQIDAAQRLRVK